jgi:hypothetical protein
MMKNLNYTLGDTVNQVQKGVLHDIAHACPVDNGHAVYAARSFISIIYPGILTAYFNCDGGQNFARVSKGNNNLKTDIFIFPNPTNETLKISGLESDKSYKIIVYDLTGRIVFEQIIIDSDVNLNRLQAGIYLYKIEGSDSSTSSGRISIIK